MRIGYLGPADTFTEKVAKELFPNEELIPLQPIRNVVIAVEHAKVERGIVPLENFYNGEVRETIDALTECNRTKIIAEKALTIVHCLGALPAHRQINKILSKDQALEQCSKYLCENYQEAIKITTSSTAEAVQRIIKENMLDAAVIASKEAIIESGLKILATDICPNNKTRFVVLSRSTTSPTGHDKTFLAIHPPIRDKPGILYRSLGFFSNLEINLEYIQSRPDGKKGYYFYIELDGHEREEKIKIAIEALRLSLDPKKKYKDVIKILGSYPNTQWKDEK